MRKKRTATWVQPTGTLQEEVSKFLEQLLKTKPKISGDVAQSVLLPDGQKFTVPKNISVLYRGEFFSGRYPNSFTRKEFDAELKKQLNALRPPIDPHYVESELLARQELSPESLSRIQLSYTPNRPMYSLDYRSVRLPGDLFPSEIFQVRVDAWATVKAKPIKTKPARLASLFLHRVASVQWVSLDTRDERDTHREAIWDMLVNTYREIGVKLSSPRQMDEYDVWSVALIDGEPVAFNLSTITPYGVKSGLSGSNGTTGKLAVRDSFKKLFQTGFYAEVSHKVEHLCQKMNVPVVCAEHAKTVLKKQITPSDDLLHYERNLSGVGVVTKVLVGRPRGIPTTTWDNPSCGLDKSARKFAIDNKELPFEGLNHYACKL
jgi:hypothetical protein